MLQSWYSAFLMVTFFSFALVLTGCEDEDSGDASKSTQLVNSFIMVNMESGYLWNDKMPKGIVAENEPDPFALFDKLIYKEYDPWSYITDDAYTLFKSYEGVSKTYGYIPIIYSYKYNGADYCFLVIQAVYSGSPAEKAGLKRGDIILGMDGSLIPASKWRDVFYSDKVNIRLGELDSEGVFNFKGSDIALMSVEMDIDAINKSKVINKGASKIGYICYTDYVPNSHNKLIQVFKDFKAQNVTDIVLDLRCNLGGATTTTRHLCSILAPYRAVSNKDIFLTHIWNNDMMEIIKSEGEDLNEYFDEKIGVNMDLSRLYVLTTDNTASASEATIVGLSSHMDVIQIGSRTHGKYCAAALIQPKNKDDKVIKEIENWALSMVIYKFANKDGFTDFKGGLQPDYVVQDDWTNFYPFGDEKDPLLAKAIELITGRGVVKAAGIQKKNIIPDVKPIAIDNYKRGGMLKLMDQR